MPPYAVADYGRLDAGIRRDGDLYLVSLCGVDRLAWWEDLSEEEEMARRAEWTAALIADVDRHYPGLAGAVVQSEIATARTMMNRLGTPEGSVYGFPAHAEPRLRRTSAGGDHGSGVVTLRLPTRSRAATPGRCMAD
jgi:phytoene dehydrogenase-like protein